MCYRGEKAACNTHTGMSEHHVLRVEQAHGGEEGEEEDRALEGQRANKC